MQELKLIALDAEDLNVISAHLQDAVLKVGDIAYLPRDKRFVALANRFNWTTALTAGGRGVKPEYSRHRSALRFEQVTSARLRDLDLSDKDRVLSMLAVQFEPAGDGDPSGAVTLTFSGGSAIRLDVNYVEAELRDLGGAWSAQSKPEHPGESGEETGKAEH